MTPSNRLDGTNASATQRSRVSSPARSVVVGSVAGLRRNGLRRHPDRDRAGERQDGEREIAERPEPLLLGQSQVRLDRERIGEQAEQAAEVAHPIEEVRVTRSRMAECREPALQERGGGRHDEERQSDGRQQEADQFPVG